MASVLLSLPELYNSYKTWLSRNPQIASEYESTAKWISYFIAGRINNSNVVSELVYCLSNLLILFNDCIIKKKLKIKLNTNNVDKIKLWLAVIEYSEVFCELSAQRLWGNVGKWAIIVSIQIFKCVARLYLVYKCKENIIENPIISPLDRSKVKLGNSNDFNQNSGLASVSFTLRRSGRMVRKIDSSPSLVSRTWKPLQRRQNANIEENNTGSILTIRQLIAETLYVTKPLMHLLSMHIYGDNTWKPWILSLAVDATSLQLYRSSLSASALPLTEKQKLQLSKRTVLLLLYVLRSPFYEKHSANKIKALLTALSNNIPLAKLICVPLMQYLPFWQSNYFYMWST